MSTPIRPTSGLAVTSLVCGILGFTVLPCIGSIVAIVTGHLARAEVRRAPEHLQGSGMALAGLILGYSMLLLTLAGLVLVFFMLGGLVWLGMNG